MKDSYVGIVVLDPESSDPTWGMQGEALVLHIPAEDLAHVESGELSMSDIIARYRNA